MSFRPPRSEQGFTLVEVLLAVALVAVIATMVFSALYLTASAIDRTRAAATEEQLLRSTLRVMADELAMSLQHPASPWIGINGQQGGEPADTIAFMTVGPFRAMNAATDTEMVRIVYTRNETALMRIVRRNIFGINDESLEQMELAKKVRGFNVRYYNRTGNIWSDEWDGRARSGVPTAILIELSLEQDAPEPRIIRQWVSVGAPS
ncbi:MAG: type II secretion system protein GspJ [Nitrospira sp.]|nr:type II secretion system protein GspJ [Nitrospira sp.]